MADQDQTATDAAEVSADLTDNELEKVVGGDVVPLGGIAGESNDVKHKPS